MGDGTGCDNMTAVIVQFKSKLLDSADRATEESTNNKRSAEDETDQEQNNKRIKTDQDESIPSSVSNDESSEAAAAAESITENT